MEVEATRNNQVLCRRCKPSWRSAAVAASVAGGLCAVPFAQVPSLTHESLIRRAASLVTDSSGTFLSQTTLALIDAITEYSKAVQTLVTLQKRYLASLGKLSQAEEDSVWQVMIGQRAEVNDRQEECKRFEAVWVSALRLCETAAEAAHTSGAEHASITMQTNIQVARSQAEEARKFSRDADKKLLEAKALEVQASAQRTSALEQSEEDVPEAYLRED
ncbi:diablo, IAP-binding mitochondrial protein a isoform X2 [Phyllopteryx taeniolatus]|uniref:diablo, IAP-binding mitochondrial protein a isoform X2 n=1 Tax=Phyllopteryx taeniolatus TaxID=161469 RepID=UPI002AD429D0|nr:diablo, IAP-binding mitochondrial protein a isoform X2 [Phyllopteryx taeniolatus]XP_061638187.1 diablo, IAP-binding mitochondrial protein a isoform X2 [Phyllopteryx taeniolatus]